MAHHEVDRVVAALEAVADLKPACDALWEELPDPKYGRLDAGANKSLVVLPGYGPLVDDPTQFFYVMPDVRL